MEIENQINNDIKIEKNNFFKDIIGNTVSNAMDIGLRAILPDLIEEQVIDIKNALIKNGLKSGIDVAIDSVVDLGKSAKGIFTGEFENSSQIDVVLRNGGIIDTISDVLDKTVNKTVEKGYINNGIARLIKGGKDVILENVEKNIKSEIELQESLLGKLETSLKKWENFYNEKNFNGMDEAYNEINEEISNVIPLDNVLKNINKVNVIHNLIKNNGHNFEISEIDKELAEKLLN